MYMCIMYVKNLVMYMYMYHFAEGLMTTLGRQSDHLQYYVQASTTMIIIIACLHMYMYTVQDSLTL